MLNWVSRLPRFIYFPKQTCHTGTPKYLFTVFPMFGRSLGTAASSSSNHVVAILGKLGANRSSFFRSCEQNGGKIFVIAFNPLQSFCHQRFNFLFYQQKSPLLHVVWHSYCIWLLLVGERTKTAQNFLQGQEMSETHFTQSYSVQDGES